MRICFMLGGLQSNGGIGRVTSVLANYLADNSSLEIYILSYVKENKPMFYELNKNIKHDYVFDRNLSMSSALLQGVHKKIKKYVEINDIDILIGCGTLYFPLIVLGTLGTKTKTIAWEHSNFNNIQDHKFQEQSRKIGIKNADIVVTLTKSDQISYKDNYERSNIKQIYNPIDNTIFQYVNPFNNTNKKIITVGRLSEPKNYFNLIEVAELVLPLYPKWQWDIYGEGELREELENAINKSCVSNQLHLKGQVNNIYEIYPNYSFQVMTSKSEGFPMALLEGMANGLPLLSYDINAGPNEIIIEGRNGFLIEPFRRNEMATKIEKLINEPKLRKKMSKENLVLYKRFTLEEIAKQWEVLFKELSL